MIKKYSYKMNTETDRTSQVSSTTSRSNAAAWKWVPTLYFAEGFPYVLIVTISVIMYKQLGLSNADAALYTGWLYLPWVIKPLWSPFVDLVRTKRWWVLTTQFILGAGLAGIAFIIPTSHFLQWTLAIFWLLAFSSATHDISIDGFYMLGLDDSRQAFFAGIRNTAYRIATIAGQGGLLMLVGFIEKRTGSSVRAWSIAFIIAGVLMLLLAFYHSFAMPHAEASNSSTLTVRSLLRGFIDTFISYFRKPYILRALLFILFFRLAEAQLTKICPLFLLDSPEAGGLGLTTDQVGFAQGTIGVIGLLAGGILGGAAISRGGLGKWLWPMVMAISIPDIVYVILSFLPTQNLWIISSCIFIEQLGYGFGFTGYTLYMIYFSRGGQKTSHYAISTGIMALGMMLPGMFSGSLQQAMGYRSFFIWIMICCAVTFAVSALIRFDHNFGKK